MKHVSLQLFLVAAIIASSALAQEPVGQQFQINSYTTDNQVRPAASIFADGSFVVVWESGPLAYPGFEAITARRFASDGTAAGADFQINTLTGNIQGYSAVASNSQGTSLVAWHSSTSAGADVDMSIQGRILGPDGSPVGEQFQINTLGNGDQRSPDIASTPNDDFIVVWKGPDRISAQTIDSAGNLVGQELLVNSVAADSRSPKVATSLDSGFTIVWHSDSSVGDDQSGNSIQGRQFDSSGTPLDSPFQVNTYTTNNQQQPDVAIHSDGSFLVVWDNEVDDFFDGAVKGQRFASDASPVGGEFQINTTTRFGQSSTEVEIADGGFFVMWSNLDNPDFSNLISSVRGQRLSADATPLGGEFEIATLTSGSQYIPSLTANQKGKFLVSWTSSVSAGTDNDGASVQGRLFSTVLFADGFESGNTSRWSNSQP